MLHANEVAYEGVQQHLQGLSWLLPGHQLTLIKRGAQVSDGVMFKFARTSCSPDGEAGLGDDMHLEWSTDTGQLSGGQRTLLSLAFMVAVSA